MKQMLLDGEIVAALAAHVRPSVRSQILLLLLFPRQPKEFAAASPGYCCDKPAGYQVAQHRRYVNVTGRRSGRVRHQQRAAGDRHRPSRMTSIRPSWMGDECGSSRTMCLPIEVLIMWLDQSVGVAVVELPHTPRRSSMNHDKSAGPHV